jgi:glucosylceramidase
MLAPGRRCSWILVALVAALPVPAAFAANETVSHWVTHSDQSKLLQPQAAIAFAPESGSGTTIDVNDGATYQTMDGFGASLTDSSAWVISQMGATERATLLNNLFSTNGNGIGLSILRQPLGASDFARSDYNYDNTCCDLNDFSVSYEDAYIVPVLQQIRGINSNVLIMGTPWSAPGWMKTNGSMMGGWLQAAHYPTFAQYIRKWVDAYQAKGIPIWAVTPQNEPMHETPGYPTMRMDWTDENNFIKNNLGPALSGTGVKIVALDHNWDLYTYATNILADPTTNPYVAGTGFHCYSAGLTNQSLVRNQFPSKDIWHTECSDGNWVGGGTFAGMFDRGMREMTIDVIRNWAKATIKWNLALDANHGPTNGGCMDCLGTVTVNGNSVTYNAEYYFLGHASKFVQRNAYRVSSSESGGITNVAFKNPNGGKVLVAYNTNSGSTTFRVRWAGQSFTYSLPAKSAVTFTW